MKRYFWAILILVVLGAVVGYRELSRGVDKKTERGSGLVREIPVKLAPVKRGPIAYILQTSGDVLPLMQVDVVPRVPGYVERILFQIGDKVDAGQVVATVDSEEHRHRVEENEAAVRVAEATVQEKESDLLDVEKQRERARLLRQKEFISTQELDTAETRVHTAKAQRELAVAQLAQRRATLAQARYQLSLTRITAPFSGVVVRRFVDPGAHVSSSNPIVTLAVPDPLKVVVNIPESDVSLVRTGMQAKLQINTFPDRSFEGRIARLNSALDSASRTLMVEIHVPNSGGIVKPGMFARVSLVLGERRGSLLVPGEAVIEEEGKRFVYTVEGGRAQRKAVTSGWAQDGLLEITAGVGEGEYIVVAGQHRLRPGTRVQILEDLKPQ